MGYRDELRLDRHQPLLQEANSLPQPRTVTPISRDKTPSPGQAFDLLGRVVTARPATFGRLD